LSTFTRPSGSRSVQRREDNTLFFSAVLRHGITFCTYSGCTFIYCQYSVMYVIIRSRVLPDSGTWMPSQDLRQHNISTLVPSRYPAGLNVQLCDHGNAIVLLQPTIITQFPSQSPPCISPNISPSQIYARQLVSDIHSSLRPPRPSCPGRGYVLPYPAHPSTPPPTS
jgi:hypothetical protein